MSKWTPTQQAEHRRAWIKALRSGEYSQARGALRKLSDLDDQPEFCCLGVACDVYLKSGDAPKVAKWRGLDHDYGFQFRTKVKSEEGYYHDYYVSGSLPQPVCDWLGLKTNCGEFFTNRKRSTLISENDHSKKTFNQIADIVEKEPKGLIADDQEVDA
jgi:hypothetical protein